jgi:membrane-associated phospholipid phosphatase
MLAGFTDVVSNSHAFGDWHDGPLASHANQLAAMPSLHMAWAAWCALVVWRACARRWVRAIAIAHPCLTAFTVMATGNHFLLDLVAGLLVLALAVALTRLPLRLATSLRRPRPALAGLPRHVDRSGETLGKRAVKPAYRMSQTCYEVADKVE